MACTAGQGGKGGQIMSLKVETTGFLNLVDEGFEGEESRIQGFCLSRWKDRVGPNQDGEGCR